MTGKPRSRGRSINLGGQAALERTEVIDSPNATHLRYRVINTAR
ncbi:hypothetical protein [Microlunatus parietis]|uniref:Uncharacterized protein n=1 Tax=Microlunatus parietis TaxID=682979 RepID=A0A7Y9I7U6_9ACTN|nr:hypothetical protein [Microlunatus parietis]NYE71772.1 hypothetical protein [Microlunatus parietis]